MVLGLILLLLVVFAGAWLWRKSVPSARTFQGQVDDRPAQPPDDVAATLAVGAGSPSTDGFMPQNPDQLDGSMGRDKPSALFPSRLEIPVLDSHGDTPTHVLMDVGGASGVSLPAAPGDLVLNVEKMRRGQLPAGLQVPSHGEQEILLSLDAPISREMVAKALEEEARARWRKCDLDIQPILDEPILLQDAAADGAPGTDVQSDGIPEDGDRASGNINPPIDLPGGGL